MKFKQLVCKRCGQRNLHWELNPQGNWRLYNTQQQPHDCETLVHPDISTRKPSMKPRGVLKAPSWSSQDIKLDYEDCGREDEQGGYKLTREALSLRFPDNGDNNNESK